MYKQQNKIVNQKIETPKFGKIKKNKYTNKLITSKLVE